MAPGYLCVPNRSPREELLGCGPRVRDCEAGSEALLQGGSVHSRRLGVLRAAAAAAAVLALIVLASGAQYRAGPRSGALAADLIAGAIEADLSFDCQAGVENWARGWSEVKKEWCCAYRKLGCEGNPVDYDAAEPFDCSARTGSADLDWSVPKMMWCCHSKNIGCPYAHHVTMTFLVTEVNYKALRQTEFIIGELQQAVKDAIVEVAPGKITAKNITLTYWAGSGLHASTPDSANTGVVFRAKIAVPDGVNIDTVRASLSTMRFPMEMRSKARKVKGIDAIRFGQVGVHDVTVEMAIVRACTCDHGIVAGAPMCPKSGGKACSNCDDGYHMTSAYTCEANICHCEGGIASQGELCETHMSRSCASCMPGYHYNITSQGCLQNSCTCPMGWAATGAACTMHLGEICTSCYPGYHVDTNTKQCTASMCTCPNGKPVDAKDCPKDGSVKCNTCAVGFHIDKDGHCEQNVCKCKGGTAALGDLCPVHGREKCAFCHAPHLLHADGRCGGKECLCANGIAATGGSIRCTTNGATVCTSCNSGFTLHANSQCLKDECHCDHGLPLDPKECRTPGESNCAKCFDGYELQGGYCKAYECKCDNGEPSRGASCPAKGAHSCSKCQAGYQHKLKGSKGINTDVLTLHCVPNTCTCVDAYGSQAGQAAVAASDPACHSDGANICIGCLPSHHRDGDQCVANKCTCKHGSAQAGTPVQTGDCIKDSATNCTKCNSGYWLAEDTNFKVEPKHTKPAAEEFAGGAKLCLPGQFTTKALFDCKAGLDNWEKAWSDQKKYWCCRNEDRGCAPQSTGRQLCENQGYDQAQCHMIGCCTYNIAKQACFSAIGHAACYPEFSIRSSDGLCIEEGEKDPQHNGKMFAKLSSCSPSNQRQSWRPDESKQLANPTGFCLSADKTVGAKLAVEECKAGGYPPQAQRLVYSAGQIKLVDESSTFCLSGSGMQGPHVLVKTCDKADVGQFWAVPQVQPIGRERLRMLA